MHSRAHQKVRYALSNKRAYIATNWWSRKLEAIPILPSGTITLENGKDVYFRTEVCQDSDGDRTTQRMGFENIEDAKEVYRLMRDVQDNAVVRPDD